MQYLPIYPEKSWSETVLPSEYRGNGWEDGLPLTDSLITSMASLPNNYPETLYPRAIGGISMPFIMLTDAIGTIGNTAYNGYKRVYNYGANAYNNMADDYNNWRMNGGKFFREGDTPTQVTPQTSLTGRKLTYDMNPAYYNQTIAMAEKPKQYLVGTNGNIVAEIRDPYPYVSRVVQAQQLGPSQEERRNMMPLAAPVQSN